MSKVKGITILLTVIPFFIFSLQGYCGPSTQKSVKTKETHKDLISKAQNLSLQRDRLKATQVLLQGLESEKQNSKAWLALIQSLDQLSKLFYTEQAQKAYGLGESLYFSGSPRAAKQLQDSLELEPGNVAVMVALCRAYLSQNDCGKAYETCDAGLKINPFEEAFKLHRLQSLSCMNQRQEAKVYLGEVRGLAKSQKKYLNLIQAKWLLADEKYAEATDLISKLIALDPEFPEPYYLQWQLANQLKQRNNDSARKYVSICQNVTPRLRRKYQGEPMLCAHTSELESQVKTGSGVGQAE